MKITRDEKFTLILSLEELTAIRIALNHVGDPYSKIDYPTSLNLFDYILEEITKCK